METSHIHILSFIFPTSLLREYPYLLYIKKQAKKGTKKFRTLTRRQHSTPTRKVSPQATSARELCALPPTGPSRGRRSLPAGAAPQPRPRAAGPTPTGSASALGHRHRAASEGPPKSPVTAPAPPRPRPPAPGPGPLPRPTRSSKLGGVRRPPAPARGRAGLPGLRSPPRAPWVPGTHVRLSDTWRLTEKVQRKARHTRAGASGLRSWEPRGAPGRCSPPWRPPRAARPEPAAAAGAGESVGAGASPSGPLPPAALRPRVRSGEAGVAVSPQENASTVQGHPGGACHAGNPAREAATATATAESRGESSPPEGKCALRPASERPQPSRAPPQYRHHGVPLPPQEASLLNGLSSLYFYNDVVIKNSKSLADTTETEQR
ncbi:uncharacterized protein AAEQ78_021559 [Lycaon pictus]